MTRTPTRATLITPIAASWIWKISDARLRRLAIDGKLPHRTLRGWGKPARVYFFDACVSRWGAPDDERLSMLMKLTSYQMRTPGATIWEILTVRPKVLDDDGDLAIQLEEKK